jgi:hypothetical protein
MRASPDRPRTVARGRRPCGVAEVGLSIALVCVGLVTGCQPSGPKSGGSERRATSPPANDSIQASPDRDPAGDAANVVEIYYRAIDEKQYRAAYQLWESNGAASGKSFEEFRAGFSETAAVELIPGAPGRVEGAAGSQYVEVPVRVVARLRSGSSQVFAGTYTLRRSVVDGAMPEQRAWHIYSAKLTSRK